MKPIADIPKSTLLYTLLVFIFAAYAVVRVINLSQAVQKVKATADTKSYARISNESLLGSGFLASSRPFVFPLLLKTFRNEPETVAWAQGLISIVSWSLLAACLASALRAPLARLAAFGLILFFSLNRYIIGWDSVLLTESLSLSFLALFIAAWLWLIREWHWAKVVSILVVALLWTFARDTNAWVVLMIALFLLVLLGLRVIDREYLLLGSAFLILFLLSNLSADLGDRWVFPFQNVLGRRILPDARAVNFFTGCGMPMSPELMQLAGGYANSSDRAFYEDPALQAYRLWLHQAGKACYMKWLLSDPLESMQAPLTEFDALIGMQNIQPFLFSKRFSPILPARLEAMLFPRHQLVPVLVVLWAAALIAILTRVWRQNKAWWVAIGIIVLIFPHYFITWHGDVMGIYRHVVSASVQFYLGMWLLILLALDQVLSFRTIQAGRLRPLFMRSAK